MNPDVLNVCTRRTGIFANTPLKRTMVRQIAPRSPSISFLTSHTSFWQAKPHLNGQKFMFYLVYFTVYLWILKHKMWSYLMENTLHECEQKHCLIILSTSSMACSNWENLDLNLSALSVITTFWAHFSKWLIRFFFSVCLITVDVVGKA